MDKTRPLSPEEQRLEDFLIEHQGRVVEKPDGSRSRLVRVGKNAEGIIWRFEPLDSTSLEDEISRYYWPKNIGEPTAWFRSAISDAFDSGKAEARTAAVAAQDLLHTLQLLVRHDEASDLREELPNCAELEIARTAIRKAVAAGVVPAGWPL